MSGSCQRVVSVSDRDVREHELILSHPDGRRIQLAILGARDFTNVVFYSHGFPASRLEASIAHGAAREMGITVIALDRPGFGGSDWYSNRQFKDWANDVALAADHLGVQRFGILGVSGGTPTAVAAAGSLGSRVTALAIVSGVGPIHADGALSGMNWANRSLLRLGSHFKSLGGLSIGAVATVWRSVPGAAELWFASLLPKADIEIVKRPEVGVVLARNIQESLKRGVKGAVSEFQLLVSDWRPLLEEVKVPTTIWHGDEDTYVPISMARIVHQGIAGSRFHEVKGGGHFMIVDRLRTVLELFV